MTTDIHESPALAMIHTVPGIIPVFNELVGLYLPGWRPFNMLDESLLGNTIREGTLSAPAGRRQRSDSRPASSDDRPSSGTCPADRRRRE